MPSIRRRLGFLPDISPLVPPWTSHHFFDPAGSDRWGSESLAIDTADPIARIYTRGETHNATLKWTGITASTGALDGVVTSLGDPEPDDLVLDENSGLVVSRTNTTGGRIFWTHNDSGGAAAVYAYDDADPAGIIATYTVGGASNGDWEDIAIGPGPTPGVDYLYVGNVGNGASTKRIYRFPEPTGVVANQTPVTDTISSGDVDTFTFTWPIGHNGDCEGMFVDPVSGDLFLFEKRQTTDRPATSLVHKVTADQLGAGSRTVTLTEVGTVTSHDQQVNNNGGITGADIAHDGSMFAICNYQEVWAWERPEGSTVDDVINGLVGVPVVGIYNGNPSETPDENTLSVFGTYPPITTSYYPGGTNINMTYETDRAERGTHALIQVDTKNAPITLTDIANETAAAITWMDDRISDLHTLSQIDPATRIYTALESEFELKVNRSEPHVDGVSNETFAAALDVWHNRLASAAPDVTTCYWFGGSDWTDIHDIMSFMQVSPQMMVFDPYRNPGNPSTMTFAEKAGPKLTTLIGSPDYARLGSPPVAISETGSDTGHGDQSVADYIDSIIPGCQELGFSFAVWFNRDSGPINNCKLNDGAGGSMPLSVAALGAAMGA